MRRLTKNFFQQATLVVAKELLGKILIFNQYQGIITETEAYIGEDDPACHAAKGKTKRTAVMYGAAGYSYVYMIYGMYHCLNIVTEKAGFPAAVLIRGLRLLPNSKDQLQKINNSGTINDFNGLNLNFAANLNLDGPGKLCKFLGITTQHNNINLNTDENFYVKNYSVINKIDYIATPRIGIKVGLDKLWRFKLSI